MRNGLRFLCTAAAFVVIIATLCVPDSLFAGLESQGGLEELVRASPSDPARATPANKGKKAHSAPRIRLNYIGVKPLLGISLAVGDEYDSGYIKKESILSFGLGIEAEYIVGTGLYIVSGLTYIRKGQFYEKYMATPVYGYDWLDVDQYVHYLQVPAMVRYRWRWVDPDEVIHKNTGFSYYAGLGLGLDVAVASGGKQYNDGGSDSLGSAYFDSLRRFNISILGNLGVEYTFNDRMNCAGLDLGVDYHLLNDWDFPAGTSSHFLTFTAGVFYRFHIMR
jgi:hypothetical protein